MHRSYKPLLFLTLLISGLSAAIAAGPETIHHQLQVKLTPLKGQLTVTDRLTLPRAVTDFEFILHRGLNPVVGESGISLVTGGRQMSGEVPVTHYRLSSTTPFKQATLNYGGVIQHRLSSADDDYGSSRKSSPGIISAEGVFLSGAGFWYPQTMEGLVKFDMTLDLPPDWLAVSQGASRLDGGWTATQPQDDIYLIAAPYHRYSQSNDIAEAQVYLRRPDPALAKRYLEATGHYLALYQALLGPYPYGKFALVENFWESGYGMPSFTLLGPQVIRLPFILHSSYPHEILHNWWGNGVYVDYNSGNWSEGLTSYLADHLIKEQRGGGADYRRGALQNYSDYVKQQKEFPLTAFRGRHSQSSQAVGYGKTLMLFHMLRMRLGDEQFIAGLRHFYRHQLFQNAGFDDLKRSFEAVAGESLSPFFQQWTERTGAPALSLNEVKVTPSDTGYRLTAILRQEQSAPPYRLQVPLFIQLEGQSKPRELQLEMIGDELQIDIKLKQRPLRLAVDPRFDLFRRLDPSEIPSSLGQLFSGDGLTIILPAEAEPATRSGYRQVAEVWAARDDGIEIIWDSQMEQLPKKQPLWILGGANRFAGLFSTLLHDDRFNPAQQSYALTRRHPDNRQLTIGLLHSAGVKALPGLARKLPHYGKYSYVAFEGDRPDNRLKGQWQQSESALTVNLTTEKPLPMIIPPHAPLSGMARTNPAVRP